jgi:hypothetical protein
MKEFKKGDRVRVLEVHGDDPSPNVKAGDVTTIEVDSYPYKTSDARPDFLHVYAGNGLTYARVELVQDEAPAGESLERVRGLLVTNDEGGDEVVPMPVDDAAVAVVDNAAATPAPAAGLKFDGGKIPWELLPDDALEQVARVLQFGAQKYAARNWENGIEYGRIHGAIHRHRKAFFHDRETNDPETGLHHLAHLACEVLFVLAYELRGGNGSALDTRPKVKKLA